MPPTGEERAILRVTGWMVTGPSRQSPTLARGIPDQVPHQRSGNMQNYWGRTLSSGRPGWIPPGPPILFLPGERGRGVPIGIRFVVGSIFLAGRKYSAGNCSCNGSTFPTTITA